jgi:hypothetical protein
MELPVDWIIGGAILLFPLLNTAPLTLQKIEFCEMVFCMNGGS